MNLKKDRTFWAEEVGRAYADMNLFAAIAVMTEGGLLSASAGADEERVRFAANRAQSRAFARYEAALTELKAARP